MTTLAVVAVILAPYALMALLVPVVQRPGARELFNDLFSTKEEK